MELRQLRYSSRSANCAAWGRAAVELGVATSALSQQISRLESELSPPACCSAFHGRHAHRCGPGLPAGPGLKLTLRHADDAVRAAQQARLSGHVSVGLAPTTATACSACR